VRPGDRCSRRLVVAEVTATFVLAVGAGLLLHTMANLLTRDLGFETRQLLVVEADAPAHSEQDAQRVVRQYDELFLHSLRCRVRSTLPESWVCPPARRMNGYYSVSGGPPSIRSCTMGQLERCQSGYFQPWHPTQARPTSVQVICRQPVCRVISESLAGKASPIRIP